MSKKDRKRREVARRQKEQRRAKTAAGESAEDNFAPEDAAPEDEASKIERRAQQKREYEKRKRAKARGSQPLAPYFWGGGVIATLAVAVIGGFLLLGGGGDEGSAVVAPSSTPDARIAGLPIDVTFTLEADDNGQNINPRFVPNTISASAGQVVEIVVTNVGSVAHNLRVAGIDGEYDSRDDWLTEPATLFSGDTGTVVVKLDDPGTYAFRCDFHATLQFGTLTVR